MATFNRILLAVLLTSTITACGGGDDCDPGLEWREVTAYGQTYMACVSVESRQ